MIIYVRFFVLLGSANSGSLRKNGSSERHRQRCSAPAMSGKGLGSSSHLRSVPTQKPQSWLMVSNNG